MQLFELFFDEEACELILQKTMLYAHGKGEDLFVLTIPEFEVFLEFHLFQGLSLFLVVECFGEIHP